MASPANGDFQVIWFGARTTDTGVAIDDVTAEEERLTATFLSEGIIAASTTSFMVDERGSGANMSVDVGSGVAENDYALIPGFAAGQENYLSRMQDATVNLVVAASDPSLGRIDSIYLVVHDDSYDAGGNTYIDLEYQQGTAAASPTAPGPDPDWSGYLLLGDITVGAGVTSIVTANITDQRVWSAIELGGGSVFFGPDTDPDDLRIETDVVGGAVNVYVAGIQVGVLTAAGLNATVNGIDVTDHDDRHAGTAPELTGQTKTVDVLGGAGDATFDLPAGLSTGDKVLLFISNVADRSVTAVDAGDTPWTQLKHLIEPPVKMDVYSRTLTAGDSKTQVTVAFNGSGSMYCYAYQAHDMDVSAATIATIDVVSTFDQYFLDQDSGDTDPKFWVGFSVKNQTGLIPDAGAFDYSDLNVHDETLAGQSIVITAYFSADQTMFASQGSGPPHWPTLDKNVNNQMASIVMFFEPQSDDAIAVSTPGTIQPDDTAAEGSATSLARSDHKHAIVAAIAGTIQPDDAASEGASTSFSRSDHKHAIVAATPSKISHGQLNAEGASTSFARADHLHAFVHAAGILQIDSAVVIGGGAMAVWPTFVDEATITFTPPSYWSSYRLVAEGTAGITANTTSGAWFQRVKIGSSTGPEIRPGVGSNTSKHREASASHVFDTNGTITVRLQIAGASQWDVDYAMLQIYATQLT